MCRDAYPADGMRRDACALGCRRMYEVQARAPIIPITGDTNWVVYMGSSDENLVVVQPPELLENSDSGWVLLNSIFRPSHDYESASASASVGYKLTETHVQTMPISAAESSSFKHRFGQFRRQSQSPFCIPAWLWLVPVLLLVALVYIQYNGSNLRSVLVFEEESEDEQEILVEHNGRPLKDAHKAALFRDADEDFMAAKLQDLPPKYAERDVMGV